MNPLLLLGLGGVAFLAFKRPKEGGPAFARTGQLATAGNRRFSTDVATSHAVGSLPGTETSGFKDRLGGLRDQVASAVRDKAVSTVTDFGKSFFGTGATGGSSTTDVELE